jgi:hypothetical protein
MNPITQTAKPLNPRSAEFGALELQIRRLTWADMDEHGRRPCI